MKTILSVLITLIYSLASAAPKQEMDVIHTLHGKSYLQCKIMQRDADGVAFSHLKGIAGGKLNPPDPESINWFEAERYKPWLAQWSGYWAYRSYFDKNGNPVPKGKGKKAKK